MFDSYHANKLKTLSQHQDDVFTELKGRIAAAQTMAALDALDTRADRFYTAGLLTEKQFLFLDKISLDKFETLTQAP